MSDDQDSLKDKQFSRREFLKLLGAGSLFLGLGAFGIPNILKNIREASAINQTAPPVLPGVMNNSNITSNDMNNLNNSDIRPFHVNVSEEELIELRRRINATRWPEKETVTDQTQGVELVTIQKLAHYWATQHDWRKVEAKLNSLPQFITAIDGLDIHFIHVRSKHEDALPLIVTHGWPGSIIEQLKIIDLLTNPTAHGATASDAFHLVIPSMPGYGFSGKPTTSGWGPQPHCTCMDRTHEAPRIHTLWSARGRLGCAYHRSDGSTSTSGIDRYSYEYGWCCSIQCFKGNPDRRVPCHPIFQPKKDTRSSS